MKKPSRWALWWLGLFAAFVIADIIASLPPHRKPRSASEYLGHLFPRGWKRAVLVAILAVALIHIATQPEWVPPVHRLEQDKDYPCARSADRDNDQRQIHQALARGMTHPPNTFRRQPCFMVA